MKPKFILLGATIGLISLFITAYRYLRFTPTTSQNTFLAGLNYSHLTHAQIVTRIDQDFQLPQSVNLITTNYKTSLSTATFSATINPQKTANAILPPFLQFSLSDWISEHLLRRSAVPIHYQLVIEYDQPKLIADIASISTQVDKPFVPTELQKKDSTIEVKKGELGAKLDPNLLQTILLEHLKNWQIDQDIVLPISPLGQLPDDSAIGSTVQKAQNLIGKKLDLTYENQTVTIDDSTLISWLNFDNTLKKENIIEYAKTINTTIARDPVNATFKFENGKVLDFRPASPGISVDIDNFFSLINSNFNNSQSIVLPLITLQPAVRNEDVNNLGIKELLGWGVSTFKHSSAIRNINVKQGSAIVNRILVAPGEEFSFIKNLGEVSQATGYQKAYIIRQGKTELDIGGGVCQVSTTLFRAMLNAGLQITTRQHHAYRVSYYEEDSKPGFDATIFIPNPDLKFINDTLHYVLIQNTYDGVNKKLTYEIYGTSDGRTVEISNYRQWGSSPPPPERWIDDPTLPVGKVVQDERAIPGLRTAFDWKVTRGNEVIRQKTFESNFVPWGAVYRRGVSP